MHIDKVKWIKYVLGLKNQIILTFNKFYVGILDIFTWIYQ